jgi:hypothetical protein
LTSALVYCFILWASKLHSLSLCRRDESLMQTKRTGGLFAGPVSTQEAQTILVVHLLADSLSTRWTICWETPTIAGLNSTMFSSSNHRTSLVIIEWDSRISDWHNCQFGLPTTVSQYGWTLLFSKPRLLSRSDAKYQRFRSCPRIFLIQY